MLSSLPQVLSGEQVRCALHISKRKCAWMLNNGFINCQNTGKRTRKYTVLKADLLTYIEDSQKHPEKYVTPHAEFSTAKYGSMRKPDRTKRDFLPLFPSASELGSNRNSKLSQIH